MIIMKKNIYIPLLAAMSAVAAVNAAEVASPDGRLVLTTSVDDGKPVYSVTYDGKTILENSLSVF